MKKAKSRLKHPKRSEKRFSRPLWKRYLNYLPTLVISLPFYVGVYYLVTHFYPSQLRHWLIPNTYLPLQLLLFGGNFFFFSFIFLKARRGFLFSLWFAWSLFLKLQPLENYLVVSAVSLLVVVTIEAISTFWQNKD
jgi:hypothetical protein